MTKVFIEAKSNKTSEYYFLRTIINTFFPKADVGFIFMDGIGNLYSVSCPPGVPEDEIHDFLFVVGVEPGDVAVVPEPGHLFLGVDTCVLLDALYGHGEFPCAVEDVEHFLVSYGVQGVAVAVWHEIHGFLEQSCVDHGVYSGIDACEEFLARP